MTSKKRLERDYKKVITQGTIPNQLEIKWECKLISKSIHLSKALPTNLRTAKRRKMS